MQAAVAGHVKVIQWLLEAGADRMWPVAIVSGEEALHFVTLYRGHIQVVLIEARADKNATSFG